VQSTTNGFTLNGEAYSVQLTGNGVQGLSVAPLAHNFGTIPLGVTSPVLQTIVTNTTASPLGPLSMAGGGLSGVFSNSQNCQGVTLAPGGTCQVNYFFAPAAGGPAATSSTFTLAGQSFTVDLTGNGLSPVSVAPVALAFGTVLVGASSPFLDVVVTNVSGSPLGPLVVTGGTAAAPFVGTQTCAGATLAPGATCLFSYQFAPTAFGAAAATVSLTINGEPFSIDLSGAGQLVPVTSIPTLSPLGLLAMMVALLLAYRWHGRTRRRT
jgi:hypothetical protein